MKLAILFTAILATFTTSLPTRPEEVHAKSLSTREEYAGDAFWNNEICARLYVNGGCSGLMLPANQAAVNFNIRCRYFR